MRNADYTPVAQIPMVDLSAQYEAAKARREEAELRKLEYLNQFQKVRGPLAEGVRPEVDRLWQEIEKDLESGDMSFEAKKRRQQLYNNYANVTAEALNWTKELDEREATILANPSQYRDPSTLLNELEKYRLRPVDAASLPAAMSSLPSLSKFLRYQPKEMTPSAIAATISERLKAGGGISSLYDPKTGLLLPQAAEQRVLDYFSANGLTAEQKEQAIINELRHRGSILAGGIEDISLVQNLSDKEQIDYINSFAKRTAKDLISNLSRDITTKEEERAAELSDYAAKVRMQGRQAEREIRLRNTLDKEAPPASSVNMYAPLVSYLEKNITNDLISYDEDEIVQNIAPALSKLGFSVKTAGTWGDEISIENPNGESVKVKLPPSGSNKQVVRDQIVNAVINKLPVGTDNPEADRLMYINRLMKTGAIPTLQADRLGILND